MVTGLAHESGNALARSQACLEMLALEVEDRPDVLDLVGRIQRAQDHLRQLYEEVRGYAAPLKPEREELDLRATWRQALEHRKFILHALFTPVSESLSCSSRPARPVLSSPA